MFGINGSEFLVLIVVAVVVVGPERLPRYAEKLGVWVRALREFLRAAKQRVDEELGDQVGDVDWAALDPRQYDPRRIVREALLDDQPAATRAAAGRVERVAPAVGAEVADSGPGRAAADVASSELAGMPCDDEAT